MAIFTILGQFYIVKMAILDQFYHLRKEWIYRDFKNIFGNGMSWGTKWQGVEVARVQSAKLRIALLVCYSIVVYGMVRYGSMVWYDMAVCYGTAWQYSMLHGCLSELRKLC